jgi:hypothetical protein
MLARSDRPLYAHDDLSLSVGPALRAFPVDAGRLDGSR